MNRRSSNGVMMRLISGFVVFFTRRMNPQKRLGFFLDIFKRLSEKDTDKDALRFALELENRVYKLEGELAKRYEKGIHPKHRLTKYHKFFIDNIKPGESVIDVGSGLGVLSYDMASNVERLNVIGIERDVKRVEYAKKHYSHPRLSFICQDALSSLPDQRFDVFVLSNILEHLHDRVEFLKKTSSAFRPKRFIIRVPQNDRDWRVPLKQELGVDSRLNKGHYIEYTKRDLISELTEASLSVETIEFAWGEIWCVARPIDGGVS